MTPEPPGPDRISTRSATPAGPTGSSSLDGSRNATAPPDPQPAAPDPTVTADRVHSAPTDVTAPQLLAPAAPHLPEPPPGYDLLGVLGRGGMGVVYRARQKALRREVALKVLLAGGHASDTQRARFLTEAEAVAAVNHPGVVQVHDFGTWDGQPYLAMELCPGGTLADKLADTPLPPRDAAATVEQLARAVAAAHAKGIVHRDLKPHNVLLTLDGVPKVADFGLARMAESGEGITTTGAILGTPSYMAPEQARGDARLVGPLADVYALGAVLYKCLTGRPPFKAVTPTDTLAQVVGQEPVGVRRLNSNVPLDLETVCLKCLEKTPGKRYPSADDLAADLRRFLDGRPVAARPVGTFERLGRWRKRNPGLAAAVALAATALVLGSVASVGFGLWALDEARQARDAAGRADREAGRATTEAERANKTAEAERAAVRRAARHLSLLHIDEGLRLAREGDYFLALLRFTQPLSSESDCPDEAALARLYLTAHRDAAHLAEPVLTCQARHPVAVSAVRISPDGRRLVTAGGTGVLVWNLESGRQVAALTHPAEVYSVTFGRDGQWLLTAGRDEARVWNFETGRPVTPPLPHPGYIRSATFSPDGRRVITAGGGGNGTDEVKVWDGESGRLLGSAEYKGVAYSAAVSPDGRSLWVAGSEKPEVLDFESCRRVRTIDTRDEAYTKVAFGANGRRVFLQGIGDTLVLDPDSGEVLVTLKGGWHNPWGCTETNGWRVLLCGKSQQVILADAISGQQLNAVSVKGSVGATALGPDGRWVATSEGNGIVRVWSADTDKQVSLRSPPEVAALAFGPTGQLLVVGGDDGTVRVWDLAGRSPVHPPVPRGESSRRSPASVALSPDGRLALLGRVPAEVWDIGTRQRMAVLREDGQVSLPFPQFSPAGRAVTYSPGKATLWEPETGRRVAALTHPRLALLEFSADGRRAVSFGTGDLVRVWDVETGRQLSAIPGKEPFDPDGLMRWVLSSDGRRLWASFRKGPNRLWDLDTGREVTPSEGIDLPDAVARSGRFAVADYRNDVVQVYEPSGGSPVAVFRNWQRGRGLTFAPDATQLLSIESAGRVRVRRLAQPKETGTAFGTTVSAAMFSPDGRMVATVGRDGAVRVWDASSGHPVTPYLEPLSVPRSVVFNTTAAFSPNGKWVLVYCKGTVARVWDVSTGRPITPEFPLVGAQVWNQLFTPDGRGVVAIGRNEMRLIDLSPDGRTAGDLGGLAEVWSAHRVDERGLVSPLTAGDLDRLWSDLRVKYPREFATAPEAVRQWREAEIRDAMRAGDVRAAQFHFWCLVAELGSGQAR